MITKDKIEMRQVLPGKQTLTGGFIIIGRTAAGRKLK
jgi:hypothetical protein